MNRNTTLEVTAQIGRKGPWKIALEPGRLVLSASENGETLPIPRAEVEEKVELFESLFTGPSLLVKVSKKKIVFKLSREQAALVREWLGPPTEKGLRIALRRRLHWSLPIGILFVILSIPLPGDPVKGMEPIPFDPFSAFLGLTLILLSVFKKVWPRRILFLLDSFWFLLLAIHVLIGISTGNSLWWLLLVFVLIVGAREGFSDFRRFSAISTPMPAEGQAGRQ